MKIQKIFRKNLAIVYQYRNVNFVTRSIVSAKKQKVKSVKFARQ